MADLKPGDHVRSKYSEGCGVVTKFWKATEPGTSDAVSVKWESTLQSSIAVASVEVAHYAAPDVAMVPMTPETIARANHVFRQHFDHHEGLAAANRLYASDVDCGWDACFLASVILGEVPS